jgi:hypothetical protein
MVNTLLFKREGLVLLHNVDTLYPKEPDPKDYNKRCEFYGCRCEDCEGEDRLQSCRYHHDLSAYGDVTSKDEEEFVAMEEDFSHNFSEGINLLRCCRQVHH